MSKWDRKTNIRNKNGINWFENYGISRADFKIFNITIEWTREGHKIHIDGHATAIKKPDEFDDAERLSIDLLRLYVKKMTEVINLYDEKQKTGQ